MRARVLVLCLGLALAAAGAGCGSRGDGVLGADTTAAERGSRPPAPRPPSDPELLDRLLERRSRALVRGNARAYAATAKGEQRLIDRLAARRARALGLRSAALSVDALDLDGRRATMRVTSLYELEGIAGRFGGRRRLVAVKGRRGWRVVRETSPRERHPWELAAYRRERSRHFAVLAPAGLDTSGLAQTLEEAYAAMGDVLPAGRLRRRYLVVVARTAQDARALTQGIRGVSELAAITDSRVRETGPARRAAEVVSQRLLLVWPVFSTLDAAGRARIATHELTHAALAGSTSGRTPAWLVEGLALYTSDDRRVQSAAADLGAPGAPTLPALSRPDAIARQDGTEQGRSYAYASAATHYLAERYGEEGLLDLYDAFNEERIRGRAGRPATTDRAVRRVLGVSLERFEADLRAWIAGSGGA